MQSGANIQDKYRGTVARNSYIPKKNKLENYLQILQWRKKARDKYNNETTTPATIPR